MELRRWLRWEVDYSLVGEVGDASAATDIQRAVSGIVLGCCDGETGSGRRLEDRLLAWEAHEAE